MSVCQSPEHVSLRPRWKELGSFHGGSSQAPVHAIELLGGSDIGINYQAS
jgi:hypothetical protein